MAREPKPFRPSYTRPDPADPTRRITCHAPGWYFEYHPKRYGLPGGRRRMPLGTTSEAVAIRRMHVAIDKLSRGIDPYPRKAKTAAPKLLPQLVEDYSSSIAARGRTAGHAKQTRTRLLALFSEAKAARVADLDVDRLLAALARLEGGTLGLSTKNGYLRSARSFAVWLVPDHTPADPLAKLRGFRFQAQTDMRHPRRALPPDQFAAFLTAARVSPREMRRLTGPDRADLYAVAALTGLRSGHLAGLTAAHVRATAGGVELVTEARLEKSRRSRVVPVPEPAASILLERVARTPAGPLWPGSWRCHAADLVRFDLAAAGIPYETAEGMFDFHALRSQYATALARAGVPLVVAQKLLGHSTPELTSNFYSRVDAADLAAAAARLGPALGAEAGQVGPQQPPPTAKLPAEPSPRRTKKPPGEPGAGRESP